MPDTSPMLLDIKKLCKSYRQQSDQSGDSQLQVLDHLDLSLDSATSVALLGDSGAGKSTLLHVVAGLEPADSGEVWFDGRALHELAENELAVLRRQQIGLIFQQFHLIDTLSIADNIRFQAYLTGNIDTDYENELVGRLGLRDQLAKKPAQLSRGQQQRVAIARALLNRPRLLLADEPTGSLDEDSSEAVMAVLMELIREAGSSLLMVTHSETMAAYLDNRVRLHLGQLQACD